MKLGFEVRFLTVSGKEGEGPIFYRHASTHLLVHVSQKNSVIEIA